MAWTNTKDMQNALTPGGGSAVIPCMDKHGGQPCPHCATAKGHFAAGADEEGRKIYHKKLFYSAAIVLANGKPQNNNVCLVQLPQTVVDKIVKNANDPDPTYRWPRPDAITGGVCLRLNKYKKDAKYSAYDVSAPAGQLHDLDPSWWTATGPTLPDIYDFRSILMTLDAWPATNIFHPRNDMQDGETITLRLLPYYREDGKAPFGLVHVHYTQQTPWDKAWQNVGWDITRAQEVFADPAVAQQLSRVGLQGGNNPNNFGGAFGLASPAGAFDGPAFRVKSPASTTYHSSS